MLRDDFNTSAVNPENLGWISLALSAAIRGKDEAATKALISQIAHSQILEAEQERIFRPVLQFFSEEDREWFDQLREKVSWNENQLER